MNQKCDVNLSQKLPGPFKFSYLHNLIKTSTRISFAKYISARQFKTIQAIFHFERILLLHTASLKPFIFGFISSISSGSRQVVLVPRPCIESLVGFRRGCFSPFLPPERSNQLQKNVIIPLLISVILCFRCNCREKAEVEKRYSHIETLPTLDKTIAFTLLRRDFC